VTLWEVIVGDIKGGNIRWH